MSASSNEARLNVRLPTELKAVIEQAATALGQSVSDYAISTLVTTAQAVLHERHTTVLSNRDRKAFMALLDDANAKPNRALRRAAKRYKQQFK